MRACRVAALGAVLLIAFFAAQAAAGSGGDPLFSRLAERSWILAEPVRTFSSANLYEEIDGEAELFLPYGFRELAVAYLSGNAGAGAQLRLEIYRHGSPRDAFGIYSQHRFPGQETIPVGPSEAIVSDASLDFFRGDRFVRIRAASPATTRKDIADLAREVSGLLEGTGAPPPEAGSLLVKSFVPGTLVYQKRAVLGNDALAPGFEAKFSTGNASGSLLLLLPRDGDSPAVSSKRIADRIPGIERTSDGLYRAPIPGGMLWLKESGPYLLGVSGKLSRENAEPVLSEMAENLSVRRRKESP